MSVVINKVWSGFFNSNPLSGSTNQSADGSQFSVNMNTPLKIPASAISCRMAVLSASIWSTSPNISPAFNNNLFRYSSDLTVFKTIVIPEGLYSLTDLQSYLSSQFIAQAEPSNLFQISGNQPTQQSIITFFNSACVLDFTTNSVGSLMGFLPQVYNFPAVSHGLLFSQAPASFNRNNSYLISTNMISNGIPVNSNGRGIIASIPIPAGSVNSIISYEPNQLLYFDAGELIGSPKMNFSFSLTNENLQPTPTNGDYWSFSLMIEYGVLMTDQPVPLRP